MSRYNNISALVPEGEHFDEQAINEGVYLTEGHLSAIEASLGNHSEAMVSMQERVNGLVSDLESANLATQQSQQTVADRDAEIERLNARIAELQKAPADEMEDTSRDQDDHGGGSNRQWPETSADRELREIKARFK